LAFALSTLHTSHLFSWVPFGDSVRRVARWQTQRNAAKLQQLSEEACQARPDATDCYLFNWSLVVNAAIMLDARERMVRRGLASTTTHVEIR
jgi:hypothetical protein